MSDKEIWSKHEAEDGGKITLTNNLNDDAACITGEGLEAYTYENSMFIPLHVLKDALGSTIKPYFADERIGEVKKSVADISKAKFLLGFEPEFKIQQGIDKAMPWYINFVSSQS